MVIEIDRFQGDPKLFMSVDGSYMVFKGCQPIMDGGLENVVFISLFTKPGWSGNILFDDPNERIGSDFEEAANQPFTLESFTDMRNAANAALKWMVDSGLASTVDVTVRNPTGNILEVIILIQPPTDDVQALLLTKNGQNWIIQTVDPAYKRA
jgi:phage gp46-like protein